MAILDALPKIVELNSLGGKGLKIELDQDDAGQEFPLTAIRKPQNTEVLDITKVVESTKTPTAFKRSKFEFNTQGKDSMNQSLEKEHHPELQTRADKSKTVYRKGKNHMRQHTFNFAQEEESKEELADSNQQNQQLETTNFAEVSQFHAPPTMDFGFGIFGGGFVDQTAEDPYNQPSALESQMNEL